MLSEALDLLTKQARIYTENVVLRLPTFFTIFKLYSHVLLFQCLEHIQLFFFHLNKQINVCFALFSVVAFNTCVGALCLNLLIYPHREYYVLVLKLSVLAHPHTSCSFRKRKSSIEDSVLHIHSPSVFLLPFLTCVEQL